MITFQFKDLSSLDLDQSKIKTWLNKVVINENLTLGELSFVFGSDDWLLDYNIRFLKHNYYTDIITFDYSTNNLVSGDLLISVDRVFDNSSTLNVSRETELFRVMVHGVLHLCGYSDKNKSDQKIMREKEDYYLTLL